MTTHLGAVRSVGSKQMKIMAKWFAVALVLGLGAASPAQALEDTPRNREQQVERYLKAIPAEMLFNDVTERMSRDMPTGEREAFRSAMKQSVDFPALTSAMRNAMLKTFTADELQALTDFYSSPIGRSAVAKMGAYMAELAPVVTAEINRAQASLQRATAQPERQP